MTTLPFLIQTPLLKKIHIPVNDNPPGTRILLTITLPNLYPKIYLSPKHRPRLTTPNTNKNYQTHISHRTTIPTPPQPHPSIKKKKKPHHLPNPHSIPPSIPIPIHSHHHHLVPYPALTSTTLNNTAPKNIYIYFLPQNEPLTTSPPKSPHPPTIS
ncbi:hypothetical protein L873DRAFT_113474 [Choiromyces venosus 120613-1]|uniref:Uncharacterized protein n=1 Tax=Choiromyces venosus 120613-1 TaxID=1336337 RepID=A0A3N4J4L4_9PEZI|nr:hypothetical protein L873DRAFT_113474 [Choiromyces venosus 120613-1]